MLVNLSALNMTERAIEIRRTTDGAAIHHAHYIMPPFVGNTFSSLGSKGKQRM